MKKYKDEELVLLVQKNNNGKSMIELLERYKPLILSKIYSLKKFHTGSILAHDDIVRILEYTFCKLIYLFPIENKDLFFSGWISQRLLNRSVRAYGSYNKTKNMFKKEDYTYDDSMIPNKNKLNEESRIIKSIDKYEKIVNLITHNGHKNFSKTELIILKRILENKTANDIAEELNCKITNIYKILYVARTKLRDISQE